METIIELSDLTVFRTGMDKYRIIIENDYDDYDDSEKNSNTIYSYFIERLRLDTEDDYKIENEQEYSLEFKASSVKTFEDYLEEHKYRLEYDVVLKILKEISNLISYLERKNKTIVLYSLEDLIVINNSDFLFINNEHIFGLNKENMKKIDITIPLEVTKFVSPELQEISEIPFSLDYRCGYFSLASLLCYCLFAETLIEKDQKEVENLLLPIYNTKLYWFILRCCERNIKDRVCIFV